MKYVWRFRILGHWLLGRRNGAHLYEVIKQTFGPRFRKRSQPYITSIQEDTSDYLVNIKNYSSPLFFPKHVGLVALYHVIPEVCEEHNWHYYEIPETKVASNDIVVDCGAAEGMFSFLIKDRCEFVYVIEPLTYFVSSLQKTFKNDQNVEILPIAIGEERRQVYITDNGMGTQITDNQTPYLVQMETIDNLFFYKERKLTYIKADLEGYEIQMLEGARLTIEKYYPKIAITTYHQLDHADLISAFLKKINPNYNILIKGIEDIAGAPVMLHAWVN